MIVISYGMQKSASSFVSSAATHMAESRGFNQIDLAARFFPEAPRNVGGIASAPMGQMRDSGYHEFSLDEMIEKIAPEEVFILKTHSAPPLEICEPMAAGQIKVLASYRDPRDIAVSMMDHAARSRAKNKREFSHIHDLEHAFEIARGELLKFNRWLAFPDVLALTFKMIRSQPRTTISMIADHLGLETDVEALCCNLLKERPNFNKGVEHRYKTAFEGKTPQELTRTLIERRK